MFYSVIDMLAFNWKEIEQIFFSLFCQMIEAKEKYQVMMTEAIYLIVYSFTHTVFKAWYKYR